MIGTPRHSGPHPKCLIKLKIGPLTIPVVAPIRGGNITATTTRHINLPYDHTFFDPRSHSLQMPLKLINIMQRGILNHLQRCSPCMFLSKKHEAKKPDDSQIKPDDSQIKVKVKVDQDMDEKNTFPKILLKNNRARETI